jgi:hypothetical protein
MVENPHCSGLQRYGLKDVLEARSSPTTSHEFGRTALLQQLTIARRMQPVADSEPNPTFLDWVVTTCDRLLAGHGLSEQPQACEAGNGAANGSALGSPDRKQLRIKAR